MEQLKQGMVAVLAASAALISAPASAEFYLGASAGESTLETSDTFDGEEYDFEASDTHFKVFGGYMFNEYFGVEAAFLDLGALDDRVGFDGGEAGPLAIDADADFTGIAAEVVGQYPIGDFDLFAKVGVISYELDGDLTLSDSDGVLERESFSVDGEELIYGVGARYNFGQIGVRAEYEVVDADDIDDAFVWSIGVEYSFQM